jgi:hypothetical protein
MTMPLRRSLLVVGFGACLPLLVMGCPKKETPAVEEAGPPPAPAPTPSVTELAPLVEDAGPDAADAAADAGKKYATGPSYNANQMKVRACCNALHAQAKQLGTAPEAAQVNMAAATCDTLVVQMGVTGTAPELAGLRQILKTVALPAVCQ